ncbi:MAG: hypothetical protein CYPHOPRED_001062 [Cyphobasidiales sp. Tagirdzhanova-0007]|nr:MAG: hypothetical protein CYPHOPRED_001062 [Cyphobasidiales sp. Tagirdzhanova-0007]
MGWVGCLSDSGCKESILLAKFEWFSTLFKDGQPDERTALPVYLGIFVLAHIFQITLAWEAIYNRNVIQVFGLCIFNLAFLIYAVIQISEIKQAVAGLDDRSLNTASKISVSLIPVIIAVAEIGYCGLSWYIYRLMGWDIFKFLGADRVVKRMYAWYQVFICILKFDFFFFVAFSLQFVLLVLQQSNTERYLTLAAAPSSLVILYIAYLGVRRENRVLMGVVFGSCIAAAAYFVFKVATPVLNLMPINTYSENIDAQLFRIYQRRESSYRLVYKSLTVFSALSCMLLLATFIVAIVCMRNFGYGLKQHQADGGASYGITVATRRRKVVATLPAAERKFKQDVN